MSSESATGRAKSMNREGIEKEIRTQISEEIRIAAEGEDRYRVFTPFMFRDGDHLAVFLKRRRSSWALSDEGHTYMHLGYGLHETDLHQGMRHELISRILSSFGIEDFNGELVLEIEGDRLGNALSSFIQALLKVGEISVLTPQCVRSLFTEDFGGIIEDSNPLRCSQDPWLNRKPDSDI